MSAREVPFGSLYGQGFVRVAVGVPHVRVADPRANVESTLALARQASQRRAILAVFPELGLSCYSADDLFHQQALLDAVQDALARLVEASTEFSCAVVVGAPLVAEGRLFNCAVVVHDGKVKGVVPKSYLPAYREFYEKRQFAAARDAHANEITLQGQRVPFGADLLFCTPHAEHFVFQIEICEDLWVPIPPSSFAALAGATVLVNLSASNALVAKADYRRLLCASQSARGIAAYLYAAAGNGESTTDLAWDGHALVYENGDLLAQSERFAAGAQLVMADVDIERLICDRMRTTSFTDAATDHRDRLRSWRHIELDLHLPTEEIQLDREVPRFPYVPIDPARRNERCAEVHHIQVEGLATRLAATGIDKVVVGISGGLDSTLALVVSARAMDRLGLPRTNVLGVTMPGFATTERTLTNARQLMDGLGVTALEIDIRPSARQMLADLKHPAARAEPVYDKTYENVQSGERTSHLFRLANHHGALVVGTGDLSELALGWCTYGVGDQMAHYNVNASVPKTLVKYLVAWLAESGDLGNDSDGVLRSILTTEISPELVPSSSEAASQPAQHSEEIVGPFELADFFLYYLLRYGYRPSRIAFLAHQAWGDDTGGQWPDLISPEDRRRYDLVTISTWLAVFLRRFVETSQFKRSTLPNGPKVGSGGSLSPRGDWRAPSDASAAAWIDELERNLL